MRLEHGVADCSWNNFGAGWQILCLCGWVSSSNPTMEATGADFDEHVREDQKPKRPK